ncbi:hypothetical protein ACP70R_039808 [Stipagrostis hirtigluma subsp. patula]
MDAKATDAAMIRRQQNTVLRVSRDREMAETQTRGRSCGAMVLVGPVESSEYDETIYKEGFLFPPWPFSPRTTSVAVGRQPGRGAARRGGAMASGGEEGLGERQEVVQEEEDYIDMDLSAAAGAPVAREFEFMSAPLDRWGEPLASPADELFYKGKLLPLHLPPRIQMVEELLDGRAGAERGGGRGVVLGISSTAPATPYESCNASPANSCYVSGELNVEEYFQEYAAGLVDVAAAAAAAAAGERKPWSRKLRFMRQLNLGLKLKASKAYLKTIFAAKPGSSDDKNALGATRGAHELSHGHGHGHPRAWRKNPFGQIRSNRCIASQGVGIGGGGGGGGRGAPGGVRHKEREHGHRRSFSSVIVRYSSSAKTSPAPTPPSSSSSSSCSASSSSSSSASSSVRTSSDSDGAVPALRRSSSASSEVENPIQGLIAYCKKSQQLASVRKSASDAGFRFLSSAASKIAAESDGLEELIENCRGGLCHGE